MNNASRAKHKVVGVYLAAGAATRMGSPKLALEPEPGRPLGCYALRAALASRLDAVIVVVRDEKTFDVLANGLEAKSAATDYRPNRLHKAVCPEAAEGMSRSLRSEVSAAEALGADAVVVLLADQPFVQPTDIDALLRSVENDPTLDYAALADRGQPKPPILLAHSMFPAVARLEGDVGARALLRDARYRGVRLSASDDSCFLDADTPDDLDPILRHLFNERIAFQF